MSPCCNRRQRCIRRRVGQDAPKLSKLERLISCPYWPIRKFDELPKLALSFCDPGRAGRDLPGGSACQWKTRPVTQGDAEIVRTAVAIAPDHGVQIACTWCAQCKSDDCGHASGRVISGHSRAVRHCTLIGAQFEIAPDNPSPELNPPAISSG
jgi:hypothetical protein